MTRPDVWQAAGRALLAHWESYSPALRGQALDALINRNALLPELFAALEKGAR